jgi:hypothetical protein
MYLSRLIGSDTVSVAMGTHRKAIGFIYNQPGFDLKPNHIEYKETGINHKEIGIAYKQKDIDSFAVGTYSEGINTISS